MSTIRKFLGLFYSASGDAPAQAPREPFAVNTNPYSNPSVSETTAPAQAMARNGRASGVSRAPTSESEMLRLHVIEAVREQMTHVMKAAQDMGEQVKVLQTQVSNLTEQVRQISKEKDVLHKQYSALQQQVSAIGDGLNKTNEVVQATRAQNTVNFDKVHSRLQHLAERLGTPERSNSRSGGLGLN